jgi:predicted RNA-binding protein associated with RNAse of E/G family
MSIPISEAQFQNAYRSAGLWFVALYMEAFLLRIDELQDDVKKTHLIEEIYDNGQNADKYESGTRTRVNCLWRIINSGRSIQALEVAANSNRLRNDFPEAYKTANDLLKRINNGEFIMPKI